jgi:two-component system chemotaxis response regulator CheB
MRYRAIVIGASTGGIEAIRAILMPLQEGFAVPIVIVQHLSPHSDNYMVTHLNGICRINVKEADEKEKILPGSVYIAPPNYHLLLEKDESLSLTVEPKENYSRPSVDIFFESAADAYGDSLIGIILTGANSDGSKGLKRIKELGGLAIVQEPKTAVASSMPKAAIEITAVDYILSLNDISKKLIELIGDANE